MEFLPILSLYLLEDTGRGLVASAVFGVLLGEGVIVIAISVHVVGINFSDVLNVSC